MAKEPPRLPQKAKLDEARWILLFSKASFVLGD
jgi:hypothetical protein